MEIEVEETGMTESIRYGAISDRLIYRMLRQGDGVMVKIVEILESGNVVRRIDLDYLCENERNAQFYVDAFAWKEKSLKNVKHKY